MRVAAPDAARWAESAVAAAVRAGLPASAATAEPIELGEKSSVFRVGWRSPSPGSCICKRCGASTGGRERLVYESVLATLSVPTLDLLGSAEDEDGSIWLVLEDAGDQSPDLDSPASRRALTQWAATLHLESSASSVTGALPDIGPGYFAGRLDAAGAKLRERLEDEALDDDDREILERGLAQCLLLRNVWPSLEAVCEVFPETLVHGDLVEENLRVIGSRRQQRVVPLDWEKAGFGPPAVDLVRLDADLYWELTHRQLGVSREEVERLALAGRVFRVLTHRWTEKSIGKVERAVERFGRLTAELAALGAA